MPEKVILPVAERERGLRLDLFLARKLQGASRSAVQRWIEGGSVTIGGSVPKASYRVRKADRIEVAPVRPPAPQLVPEPIPLKIVHEDDQMAVVDKPAGMVVHPAAGNWQGTLVNALLHHFQQMSRSETLRPGIVHRLDKETSGLMVVAKNEPAHGFLSSQFKRREVEKRYLALVYGRLKQERGTIDIPLGRHPRLRTRISTRSRRARPAVTEYRLLRHYPDFSYLEVSPRTGRTHQIRVHLQHLGHPVVGDRAYSGRALSRLKEPALKQLVRRLGRHFLHAAHLAFRHPASGRRRVFKAPLPAELADFLKALE